LVLKLNKARNSYSNLLTVGDIFGVKGFGDTERSSTIPRPIPTNAKLHSKDENLLEK
jgi:hypothetical protein